MPGKGEMSKEMRQLNDELQEIIREKKEIYAKIEEMNDIISSLESRKVKA